MVKLSFAEIRYKVKICLASFRTSRWMGSVERVLGMGLFDIFPEIRKPLLTDTGFFYESTRLEDPLAEGLSGFFFTTREGMPAPPETGEG